jgi:VWFA-related protein
MKNLVFTVTFFCLSVIAITAQTPTPTPLNKEENDVVKISTTLIQVDVSVTDKKGKQVTDLKPEDFEILENGKPQKITNFSYVEVTPKDQLTPESNADTQKNSTKKQEFIPPFPTNLKPEQIRRTIALVIDDLGLSFGSMSSVRAALKKFVDEQMQTGDLVAIIRTGSGAGFLQQFTSDKRILYAAIERVRWNPAGLGKVNVFQPVDPSDLGATGSAIADIGGGIDPVIDQTTALIQNQQKESQRQMDEIRSQIYQYNEDVFAVGTLGAINYVVKGMDKLPGRKAVVLFSEGFKLYTQDYYDTQNKIKRSNPRLMDAFRILTEMANRASVIIYTMDTRGVVNALMLNSEDNFDDLNMMAKNGNSPSPIEKEAISRSTDLYETQQGLRLLAEETGGFAVVNNNNLSGGIRRVLDDQSGYYLIGYQPDEETFDATKARFNKLTVKLNRPDLRVRYRSGFFNIKDEDKKPQIKTPRQQIFDALASPFTSNGIDLRLTSLFANDAKTGTFMRSLIYVSGNGLKFTEDKDGWQKATFDVEVMIFGDKETIVDELTSTQTIKAKADTLQEIREKGFVATVTVPIKNPGAYQMRIVLRDSETSLIGSANQFIQVPNLKKKQLTLSGIVLERYVAKNNEDLLSKKPFQTDQERDAAVRRFRLGDNVKFDVSIYNAKSNDDAGSGLVLQYRVYRDGKEIFASPENALNNQTPDAKSIDKSEVFNLGKKMLPGDYVLQVIVRNPQAKGKNRFATQWTDFEIIP